MSETTEVKVVKINLRNSEVVSWEELPEPLEQKHYDFSAEKKSSLNARYWYGIIFLLINLSAWFVRDYGQKVFPQPLYLKTCGHEGDDCFRTMGVLRVSFGCFIFFILMFLTTCKTIKLYEVRNSWHSQWWSLKFILLIMSLVAPFFLHPDIIQFYGELARVGAGIFLVLQLISVIQFITWLNKYWVPDEKENRSCFLGLFMSTIFYLASICGIGLMYPLYASKASCSLNIFFITWSGILLLVMMAISLHSKVNRGLLSSGIMAAYVVFLCWTALRSEPADPKCHSQKKDSGNNDWTTILGFLIAIFAIVMATFSTGIDSQSFQFCKDEVQMEDDIPYKYGFFHLIFSLGAMYFAMLFISWNLDHTTRKWSIDVGWASTWVKIVNEWLAASIYLWKLIAPVLRDNKVMDHEDVAQQTDNSALP